ncbi:MAG TPA: hypothetical protein VG758_29270 [Hyphomicrobiaceae bacterium]|nr:hypothetical protein [Hyphomicrobiaceae bacterium]
MRDARMRFQSPSGLLVEASTGSSDGVLDQFYRDYDAAFVLENEKEGRDGFVQCLALNGAAYAGLAARFGAFREFVLIACDGTDGRRIGGANFIAFPLRGPKAVEAGLLSVHLNYVFVNPPARRRGYLKRLVRDLPFLAHRLFAATNASDVPRQGRVSAGTLPPALVFIEQNDPYRMSREEYERDTRYTGLDQIARIGIWSRLGARIVDFPYVQPPLSAEQAADHNLLLAVLGSGADSLSACLLRDHLHRFFAISVLKGTDPLLEPAASRQLRLLEVACAQGREILLVAPHRLEQALSRGSLQSIAKPASLRDVLHDQTGI